LHARFALPGRHDRLLRALLAVCPGLREALTRIRLLEETAMDYIVAGVAAALLFVYLIYALLRPERF
jgi:K+-transporting ATPase KdpF subunit